ncbi:type II RES/Xre toxin-antitoxin system antitoxin [Chitinophaga lutea]
MVKTMVLTDKHISYSAIDDKDVMQFIKAVRNGFPFTVFARLAKNTPFSLGEWSSFLNMSERTLQRHKQEKKAFDPIYSEKILQVTLLYNLGVDVFGNKEKFDNWLETPNIALGRVKPKDLMDNSFGIGLLKDELTRIEHGVLA